MDWIKPWLSAVALSVFLAIAGCGGSSGGGSPVPGGSSGDAQPLAMKGYVVLSSAYNRSRPNLAGDALVRVMDATGTRELARTTTNADGNFTLAGVPADTDVLVRVSRSGAVEQILSVHTAPDGDQQIAIHLLPEGDTLAVKDIAAEGSYSGPLGSSVSIEADSFVDAQTGAPVSGPAVITMTPLDPTTQQNALPGIRDFDEGNNRIRSMQPAGMVEFSFAQNGRPLNLAPGKKATIQIPLFMTKDPQTGRTFVDGDTVPLGTMNAATGIWSGEGEATVLATFESPTGLAAQAEVSHFTWWSIYFFRHWDGCPADVYVFNKDYPVTRGLWVNATSYEREAGGEKRFVAYSAPLFTGVSVGYHGSAAIPPEGTSSYHGSARVQLDCQRFVMLYPRDSGVDIVYAPGVKSRGITYEPRDYYWDAIYKKPEDPMFHSLDLDLVPLPPSIEIDPSENVEIGVNPFDNAGVRLSTAFVNLDYSTKLDWTIGRSVPNACPVGKLGSISENEYLVQYLAPDWNDVPARGCNVSVTATVAGLHSISDTIVVRITKPEQDSGKAPFVVGKRFDTANKTLDERDPDFTHRLGYGVGYFYSGPSYPFTAYGDPVAPDDPNWTVYSDQLKAFRDSGWTQEMPVTWEIRCATEASCKAGKTPWVDDDGYIHIPGAEEDYKRAFYILRVRSVEDPTLFKDIVFFPMKIPT